MAKINKLPGGVWRRFNDVWGIRAKIVWMTAFLVITVGAWVTWRSYNMTLETLKQQLQMRGVSIARDVAARGADHIFTNNVYELHRLVWDTLENNVDIAYLFMQDAQGYVIVHSFPQYSLPDKLQDFNHIAGEKQRFQLRMFKSEQGVIHDIAVPILGGRAGTVRLGMSESGVQKSARETALALSSSITSASLAGVCAAYILASLLLAPLRKLTDATRLIAAGNFNVQVHHRFKDEVGHLSKAFNLMTEKLTDYEKENISARKELERKEKLRIQLLERLIAAQEEERKRISRELHDDTSQSLTALKMGLTAIDSANDFNEIRGITGELREILGFALDDLSTLARDLRPSVLDDMGLQAALTKYIEKSRAWSANKIHFYCEGLEEQRLPSYLETAAYRIVQEALTNVKKHAHAENIDVILRYKDDTLTAVIRDDGIGFAASEIFDSNNIARGLGLFGMQERAALVGGKLEIQSTPAKGTTVKFEVCLTDHWTLKRQG